MIAGGAVIPSFHVWFQIRMSDKFNKKGFLAERPLAGKLAGWLLVA